MKNEQIPFFTLFLRLTWFSEMKKHSLNRFFQKDIQAHDPSEFWDKWTLNTACKRLYIYFLHLINMFCDYCWHKIKLSQSCWSFCIRLQVIGGISREPHTWYAGGGDKDKKYIKFKGVLLQRTASYSKNALSDTYGAYIFYLRMDFFPCKEQIVHKWKWLVITSDPSKNVMMLLYVECRLATLWLCWELF